MSWARGKLAAHPNRMGREKMDQPIPLLGTPGIGFFSLLIIGGLAGWIAGMVVGGRHGLFTNILIGICGSWIGSELARIANIVVDHSMSQFLAALVGSIVLLIVWRIVQGRAPIAR
jgi:uncharacterized membrane protein YeaQ/YmgE (transglycosylase-associated protein family)